MEKKNEIEKELKRRKKKLPIKRIEKKEKKANGNI